MRLQTINRVILLTCALAATASMAFAQTSGQYITGPTPPQPRAAMQQYNQIQLYQAMRPNVRVAPRASGNPMQVHAAAKLAAALQAPCEVIDAAPLSDRPTKNPDYEIVCKDALGWIISHAADGKPLLNDCVALDAGAMAAGKAWPRGLLCSLPGNAMPVAGLKPIAAKVAPGCQLKNGTFLGGGGNPPILRYEIACKDGKGYIVDAPAPGSAASLSSLTCDEAKAAGAACTLVDKKKG